MAAECEWVAILMLTFHWCKCRSSSSAEQLLAVSNASNTRSTPESSRELRRAEMIQNFVSKLRINHSTDISHLLLVYRKCLLFTVECRSEISHAALCSSHKMITHRHFQ